VLLISIFLSFFNNKKMKALIIVDVQNDFC
jgi:hypothetical protein